MEMSVDKTIEFYNGLECYTPQAKDARDVAITTMRKYQEIQEIISTYGNVGTSFMCIDKIREVLEDGKID